MPACLDRREWPVIFLLWRSSEHTHTQSQSSGSSPRWRGHPAPDDLRPWQPLPPPLLILLAPAALFAPLRALAPTDHPHFSPPAPIEATPLAPFVIAAGLFPPP